MSFRQAIEANLQSLLDFVSWISTRSRHVQFGRIYGINGAAISTFYFVQQKISSDSKKISGELGRRLIAMSGAMKLYENQLGQFFGIGMAPQGTMKKTKQRDLPEIEKN